MYTNKPASVAVVGGGITGLSTAWYLERDASRLGLELSIELFESQPRLGGKIWTLKQDRMNLELGAESFLSRKTAGVALCREVGVASQLRGTRPEHRKTFVWHDGKMHRLPAGLSGFVPASMSSLFSSSLLNLHGKLRVAADYLIPARTSTEDESLASFMTRRLGRQAYQRLVQPLLCGIYSGDGDQLSLKATYPELAKLEREYGGLIRGLKGRQRQTAQSGGKPALPPFVTLPGGMSDLISAIARQLQRTQVRPDQTVQEVVRESEQWLIRLPADRPAHSNTWLNRFDAVVVTCPAHIAAESLASCCPRLCTSLNSIPHVSTATVNLWYPAASFPKPLDGYGFVIPGSEQRGLTAVTWTSSKHYDRAPDDLRLIRAYLGRAGAEVDANMTDQQIGTIVTRELERTMGISEKPAGLRIQRWLKGSPQYTLGHPERLRAMDNELSRLPGMYLCGASYRGVGIPDCIADARRTSDSVLQYLATGTTNETEI